MGSDKIKALAADVMMLAKMLQLAAENDDGKAAIRYCNSIGVALNKVTAEVLSNAEKTPTPAG